MIIKLLQQLFDRPRMNAPPRVSVLIPSYNHRAFITATIESILGQDYSNLEIVVVDDRSTDDSYSLLQHLVSKAPDSIILAQNEKNLGTARTLNQAAKLATGEYLILFSSDDLFLPGRLARQIPLMVADPNLQVLYCDGYEQSESGEIGIRIYRPEIAALFQKLPGEIHRYLLTHKNPFFLHGAVMRRTFFDAIGGFDDELIADDWVLNLRAFARLGRGLGHHAFLPEAMFVYRRHAGQAHVNFDRQLQMKWQVIQRYTPPELRLEATTNIILAYILKMESVLPRELTAFHLTKLAQLCLEHSNFDGTIALRSSLLRNFPEHESIKMLSEQRAGGSHDGSAISHG